jgi:hypothetical protein
MVDGYIEPLRSAIQSLSDRVAALEAMTTPAALAEATAKADKARAENISKNPGQMLHPARLPITPGLPIAPYNPEAQGVDDATEAAMAVEAEARDKSRKPPAPMKIIDGPKVMPPPPIKPAT